MSLARSASVSLPRLLFSAAVLAAFSALHAQEIDALAAEVPGAVVSVPDSQQQAQSPSALDSAVAAVSIPASTKSVL